MPKIIDATQIKRIIPSGQEGVTSYSTEEVGAFSDAAAQQLAEIEKRRTNAQIAKADIEMSTALASRLEQTKEDPEYASMGDRFDTDVDKRLGEITSGIGDGRARQQFEDVYRLKIGAARQKVNGVAWGKEVDFERGETLRLGKDSRNAAVVSGDLKTANAQYGSLIDANVERGIYDYEDGVKMKQVYQNDTAISYIESLDPDKRLNALNQPDVKKNLAPEVYAKLLRDAEGDSMIGVSQDAANYAVYDSDMTRAEAKTYNRKKYGDDPKQYALVQRQTDYEFAKKKIAYTEGQTTLLDNWYEKIALKENTIDDIKASGDWENMGAALQKTLITTQTNSVKSTKVPFNIKHHDAMAQLQIAANRSVSGAGVKLREYFIKHASELSDSQQKMWSTVSIEGVMPAEAKSGLTDVQAISAVLPKTADAEKRRVLLGQMGDWRELYIKRFGKEPSDKDRDDYVDRSILEYDTSWWWGGTKPVREMDISERQTVLEDMKNRDPDSWNLAAEYFNTQNYNPTRSEMMQKWTQFANAKDN